MSHPYTPTDEGRRRYPNDQGYYRVEPNEVDLVPIAWPCTCTPLCQAPCAGACGCSACGMRWCDDHHMGMVSRTDE